MKRQKGVMVFKMTEANKIRTNNDELLAYWNFLATCNKMKINSKTLAHSLIHILE